MTIISQERFDNRFVNELPGDLGQRNFSRQVLNACWSAVMPTSVSDPKLVAYFPQVARLLDIEDAVFADQATADVFAGNRLLPGMHPYAACYGGHQFGHWAGQLGDGRAIGLGEVVNQRGQRWELQLKGAGPTPYSRSADGRAVLRSSIREFLCSEAMFNLGVPTTRALSLVVSGEMVVRDMLYDGNPRPEIGAIVCRVAPSFIRFGNFEILAARKDYDLLAKLVDFTISRDFPELSGDQMGKRSQWFRLICERTAVMIAQWMRVGFVHGVMNTDNMSVLGLTIDYGPYGWIDNYDLQWTPNTTDAGRRRYAFGRQAEIAHWNLLCLARAISPVVSSVEDLEEALTHYGEVYQQQHDRFSHQKFGLINIDAESRALIADGFALLEDSEIDMTLFFRRLGEVAIGQLEYSTFSPLAYSQDKWQKCEVRWHDWLQRYRKSLRAENAEESLRQASMEQVNPCYVLRNYLAQEAIDGAEQGDYTRLNQLMEALGNPYQAQERFAHLAKLRPDWARTKVGCSMLSCSS